MNVRIEYAVKGIDTECGKLCCVYSIANMLQQAQEWVNALNIRFGPQVKAHVVKRVITTGDWEPLTEDDQFIQEWLSSDEGKRLIASDNVKVGSTVCIRKPRPLGRWGDGFSLDELYELDLTIEVVITAEMKAKATL